MLRIWNFTIHNKYTNILINCTNTTLQLKFENPLEYKISKLKTVSNLPSIAEIINLFMSTGKLLHSKLLFSTVVCFPLII